jgi:hypothetical protein
MNAGFTFLSEQITIMQAKGLIILELPISFIDRVFGKSTVTYKKVLNSVKGILFLCAFKRRLNA